MCTLKVPLNEFKTPDSIQGVLAARLDALPPEQKHLAKVASVMGREFSMDLVIHPFFEGVERRSLQLVNNFRIDVRYSPNTFEYVRLEELAPFNIAVNDQFGLLTIEGQGRDMYADTYAFEVTPLAKLYFLPKKITDANGKQFGLENFFSINSIGPIPINVDITKITPPVRTLKVYIRYYISTLCI